MAALPDRSRVTPETADVVPIVVVGAHLTGMPLNHELTGKGGYRMMTGRTDGSYRLFALPGTIPPKPGLVRDPNFAGNGIEIEVWALPPAAFAHFVQNIPAPLGIGKIRLEDGSHVSGFLCEAHATAGAKDITGFGGWRNFIRAANATA